MSTLEFEPRVRYWQLEDSIGYTGQDLPLGSTEITFDTYQSLQSEMEASVEAAKSALLESS